MALSKQDIALRLKGFPSTQSRELQQTLEQLVEDVSAAGGAQAAHQADSTATDVAGVVADFNSLLAKLQAAGLMASA